MHVVATAGHVDHGKSTLVQSLTGTDPDRWQEEKDRGLTIDLGFAHTTLPSGAEISFIDVPGHVRFLKNMLAGVGAVDACMFIVAATEGWKPQTEEHLRILDLLGIRRGVIALTKVGLVDDEWRQLAEMDIEERTAGTFLEGAPIIGVDAPTGFGVDDIRAALDAMLAETPKAIDRGRVRLWIDRVFAAKGAGTVVTGTLAGGSISVDDELTVFGPNGTHDVRVRSIQTHGAKVKKVAPGHRVALNLNGVSHEEVERGDAIVRLSQWHQSTRFDAKLSVLSALDHDVSRRGAFALAIGSGEYPVKVRILGEHTIAPGDEGHVRIHLPISLPLMPGDRAILRDYGREETIGGVEVVIVDPRRPASKAVPDGSAERLVQDRGWVAIDQFERLMGQPVDEVWTGPVIAGKWAVHPPALEQTLASIRERVDAAGPLGLDPAGLDERDRAALTLLGIEGIAMTDGRIKRGEVRDPLADHSFVRALTEGRYSPPDATGVDRNELRELIRRKLVIEHDGVWFAPSVVNEAAIVAAGLLANQPEGITVAELRDALGTSRKFILPLVGWFDTNGVTRRRGDLRIAGPRLPALDPASD